MIKLENIYVRHNVSSTDEIVRWWTKGFKYLNLFYLIYVVFHLTIIVTVFKNGWIFFLMPYVFAIGVLINIIFLSGLLMEIILNKLLKLNIDYNNNAPKIKKGLLIFSVLIVITFSIYDIMQQ